MSNIIPSRYKSPVVPLPPQLEVDLKRSANAAPRREQADKFIAWFDSIYDDKRYRDLKSLAPLRISQLHDLLALADSTDDAEACKSIFRRARALAAELFEVEEPKQ